MKTQIRGVLLLLLLGVVVVLVARPVSRMFTWQRDYGQAEPLVQTIWPMAAEMQRFSGEHGRSPASLDELAAFSPSFDFAAVRRFPHEFHSTGDRRFFLRVNSRFAFVIDERFNPSWWQPTNVLSPPTNPK
jgi:hypothetical protein